MVNAMEVGKMQTKLANWSQDQCFEFDDIFNIVYDGSFLYRSWLNVKSNRGSSTPGVDGTVAEDYAEDLQENLKALRRKLKSGTYSPEPVRRAYIPKGPEEVRPLGIPTVEDRIVQESLRLTLEPIYETDFSDYSFGFRPNRNCHDAIKPVATQMAPAAGAYKHWILDLDIKGYFDNVHHRKLMYVLQDRITDQGVLDLIYDTLKSGVKENGSVQVTGRGTPQGGIVSPLLANVYLNELDQWIKGWTEGKRGGDENWTYVRYADDFLIMTDGPKSRAEGMMGEIKSFLEEELRLKLSAEKSSLAHAEDGLSFLGYDLQADTTSGACKRYVPQEAKDYILGQIHKATDGSTDLSANCKIRSLNAVLRGWANYYKYCTDAAKVFGGVYHRAWNQLMDWLGAKFECSLRWLIVRHLDSHYPISIAGATLTGIGDMSTIRTESPLRHTHPYLGEGGDTSPENHWGEPYRTGHPGPDPYLGNKEEREGLRDLASTARVRDGNVCQAEGCTEGGWGEGNLPVHHVRQRKSVDDDRLENLVTLCEGCHHKVHYTDEPIVAYHKGKDESIKLS
jgi:group II intron reverse transcriptase/maturase